MTGGARTGAPATVRVLLYVADPRDAPGAVESAYHRVSRALDGTPGLVGNALLRAVDDPAAYAVLSEWTDLAAFREWEQGPGHRDTTASLRSLQNPAGAASFRIYQVAAAY
jgi:heme oxygenase (mycobilin-producing)